MSFTGNQFAILGEASSSKEKDTQVPTTDTPDQEMQDAPRAGPSSGKSSSSMNELTKGLPKQGLSTKEIKEGVAIFLKRKAEVQEEESREKRSRQRAPSEAIVHQTLSAAPQPDDTMEVEEEVDYQKILKPKRRPRCAFRYEYEHGHSTSTIGNPWGSMDNGVTVLLDVNGSRYGSGMVSLIFRSPERDQDGRVIKTGDHKECRIIWRVGIIVDEQTMIRNLKCSQVMKLAESRTPPYNQAVVDCYPKGIQNRLQHLMAIEFECASAETKGASGEWFDCLVDNSDDLQELFFGIGSHKMTIWFDAFPNAETAYNDWGQSLEEAVNSSMISPFT